MQNFGGKYLARALNAVFVVVFLYAMIPVAECADMSDEDKAFLLMYFKEEELQVVSSTRSIKSISQVAENISAVTSQDFERMNAHSLADVLNTINGVQVWFTATPPGNLAMAYIQGSDSRHVTVLIDGVPQNNLGTNMADVGIIPVQFIEKIEIVKGPASAAWGSALGGVINVITKDPYKEGLHGTASVSYGTRNTEGYRAEISGRKGDAALYVAAGGIHSDGLRFGSDALNNNLYAKLTYAISPSTDMSSSFFYLRSDRGMGDFRIFDEIDKQRFEQYFGTVSLNSRLAHGLVLDVSAYAQRQRSVINGDVLSTGEPIPSVYVISDGRRYGGSAKLTWKISGQTFVAGTDYDNGTEKSDTLLAGKQNLTKWALFVNDTIKIGDFAITPGVRYDSTSTNGEFVSPSFGATYMLTKKTILRATIARGFNIPALGDSFATVFPSRDLKVEKVMSYQAGAESGELNYFWVKVSLFRHDLKDVITVVDTNGDNIEDTTVNQGKQRYQGFEAEIRTVPFYNTTLSMGTTFVHAKDLQTNEVLLRTPKYTYDIALTYDDLKSIRAGLKARYIWWNAEDFTNSKYSNFVLDLNAAKTLYKHKDQSAEVFLTAHNLLNASQYVGDFYRNAGRWAEIGARYKF